MFGDLDKLFDKNFYNSNDGKILLIVGDENIYFEVFSVYSLDSEELFLNPNFENINDLKEKSLIKFNKDFRNVKSQIITLVTCHNNNKDRLVVHGYRSLLCKKSVYIWKKVLYNSYEYDSGGGYVLCW